MKIEDLIDRLPAAEREKVLMMAAQYKEAVTREKCQTNFLAFVREMWPGFIPGRHHAVVAKKFEDIANGKLKRLIICMPPRHTKSQFGSYLFPAWYLGKFPNKKIIQASNTAELAVGFGRNVRNLIASDRFQNVFPNIALRQDSKAAGRWATNHNGEYFACIKRHTAINTKRGWLPAGQVIPGDFVQNASGWVQVLEVFDSEHTATVSFAGLECSTEHPIWTMNQGWVFSKDLQHTDILCVESILDKMKALLRSLYGHLEYALVSPLVQPQISVYKSKQRKVGGLWWAWHCGLRALDGLRELLDRHGAPAFCGAYGWKDRQQWALQSRKLSMEDAATTSKQSPQQCDDQRQNYGQPSPKTWDYARGNTVQDQQWDRSVVQRQEEKEKLESYGDPKGTGWVRYLSTRLFGSGIQAVSRLENSPKGYLAGIGRAAQVLFGLFLGIRAAGNIKIVNHDKKPFVNFLTDGDHTFFADGILTHNCGVGGSMTGRGSDLLIIDDPHNEQEAALAATNPEVFDKAYEWYSSGPRQRLQPGAAIVIIMTRWSKRDLVGQVLKAEAQRGGEGWEIIEFPAIMPSGKPLWPEFWPLNELEALRAELPNSKWQAQYQQSPTSESAAIIKREWWKTWDKEDPPHCEFILQAWDTAFEATRRADYSACTTWGVFTMPDQYGVDQSNIILLDAFRDRLEFPNLKDIVLEKYREYNPDNLIVEKKASGAPLIYELRRMGISVEEYTPVRGAANNPNTKMTRLNAVSDIFASGRVWAPNTQWAEEVIDEVASFPSAEHDDYTDTVSLALMRFRRGGFIQTRLDEEDEPPAFKGRFAGYY